MEYLQRTTKVSDKHKPKGRMYQFLWNVTFSRIPENWYLNDSSAKKKKKITAEREKVLGIPEKGGRVSTIETEHVKQTA